jgi:hypothetical protein
VSYAFVAKQNDTNSDFRYGRRVDTEPVHRYAYFQHFEELNIKVTFTLLEIRPEMFFKIWKPFSIWSRERGPYSQCFDTKADLELLKVWKI